MLLAAYNSQPSPETGSRFKNEYTSDFEVQVSSFLTELSSLSETLQSSLSSV